MPVSTHGKICEAVRDKIKSLDLQGILPANVKLMKLIRDRDGQEFPAVLLSHEGVESFGDTFSGNAKDIGYPVAGAVVAVENQDLEYEDGPLLWRKQIRDAFDDQPLIMADARTWKCVWEPLAIIDPASFAENLFVSAFTIRVFAREVRPR